MIPRTRIQESKPQYFVAIKMYERFPMRRQAFATVGYQDTANTGDENFIDKMQTSLASKMREGKEGYLQADQALDAGANTLNLLLGAYGNANSQFLKWESQFVPSHLSTNKLAESAEMLTAKVKQAAFIYGADLVGIAMLDPKWVFSSDMNEKPFLLPKSGELAETEGAFTIPGSVNKAIVMAVVMDEEMLAISPAVPASMASSLGYSRMGITAVSLAEYIRALGYQAVPCMNDTALSVPLAIDAGLGELGRHGLLITPEFGSNVRLCKVLTDMPLITDRPISFGVKEFCDNCLLCARHCPANAISFAEQTLQGPCENNNHGVLKWYIHGERCLRFWQANGASCANCQAVCPFSVGFLAEHCQECEKCDSVNGCSLQENTDQRIRYGYLESKSWGEKAQVLTPRRRGL